jgi:hypothetical protein
MRIKDAQRMLLFHIYSMDVEAELRKSRYIFIGLTFAKWSGYEAYMDKTWFISQLYFQKKLF